MVVIGYGTECIEVHSPQARGRWWLVPRRVAAAKHHRMIGNYKSCFTYIPVNFIIPFRCGRPPAIIILSPALEAAFQQADHAGRVSAIDHRSAFSSACHQYYNAGNTTMTDKPKCRWLVAPRHHTHLTFKKEDGKLYQYRATTDG